MGDNDLTNADKEMLLIAAGWMEDDQGWWVHPGKAIIRETIEEAYQAEFPPDKD